MVRPAALALALAAVAVPALAQDGPVNSLPGVVYEAKGDVPTLTQAAATCVAQTLKPGVVNAQTIISSDIPGGVIVARNAFDYTDTFLIATKASARSTVTLEARPDRFRIAHSDIEVLTGSLGYAPLQRWNKNPERDDLRKSLLAINETLAKCIRGRLSDNW